MTSRTDLGDGPVDAPPVPCAPHGLARGAWHGLDAAGIGFVIGQLFHAAGA